MSRASTGHAAGSIAARISANTAAADAHVDFGSARAVFRTTGVSAVVNTRVALLVALCGIGCAGAFILAVTMGDYPVSLQQFSAIFAGSDTSFAATVVLEWRLPRAVASLVFGAALGVSGAIFQSVTKNPLGSPDVIGLGAGAFTGALIAISFLGGGTLTTVFALAGGVGSALVVYLMSYRRGVAGMRFVIVGIAVASALTAVNSILLLRMSTMQATVVSVWGQGTLADLRWAQVVPVSAALCVLIVLALLLSPGLRQLELGDDTAHATGIRIERTRLAVLAIGVFLIAIVTSITGPIAFVALAAPHLARLLTGAAGTTLLGSAAVGALLLSGSDVVAAHFLPVSVPVGVVTVVVGGAYLLGLVFREARRS